MKLEDKLSQRKPVVVLNSGGFDSITLVHYLHKIVGYKNLHSLHFLYGAPNESQQVKCVNKVCQKLSIVNKVITLPPFSWSSKDFFFGEKEYTVEGQYVEYRNLIFTAYALSYAESIGSERVCLALLNNFRYKDTTVEFLDGLNHISNQTDPGIFVYAPFINYDKPVIGRLARLMGIGQDEFFSCDKPRPNGLPCGECLDCVAIGEIYK